MTIVDLSGVAVTRVVYEADGWGQGELWLEGPRLAWHELPRPRPAEPPANSPRPKRVRPHPGGAKSLHPLESTIPAKRGRVGNESVSNVHRLVHELERYFAGERIDFEGVDVDLDLDGYTPFQLELVRALRRVPYGEVVSYGELAAAAGRPNAQRAAGTFCAQNRFPLFVPCHRVVAAGGIGSYGSLGTGYKRRLLELEGVAF